MTGDDHSLITANNGNVYEKKKCSTAPTLLYLASIPLAQEYSLGLEVVKRVICIRLFVFQVSTGSRGGRLVLVATFWCTLLIRRTRSNVRHLTGTILETKAIIRHFANQV